MTKREANKVFGMLAVLFENHLSGKYHYIFFRVSFSSGTNLIPYVIVSNDVYKAEKVVQGLEKKKGRQDEHIELLARQIQSQREKVAGLQEEINSYQGQMEASNRTIRETAAEMEAIDLEKKQLLMQVHIDTHAM